MIDRILNIRTVENVRSYCYVLFQKYIPIDSVLMLNLSFECRTKYEDYFERHGRSTENTLETAGRDYEILCSTATDVLNVLGDCYHRYCTNLYQFCPFSFFELQFC